MEVHYDTEVKLWEKKYWFFESGSPLQRCLYSVQSNHRVISNMTSEMSCTLTVIS